MKYKFHLSVEFWFPPRTLLWYHLYNFGFMLLFLLFYFEKISNLQKYSWNYYKKLFDTNHPMLPFKCLVFVPLVLPFSLSLSLCSWTLHSMRFPGGSDGKGSACNAGDMGSVPGMGRSSGGKHGNPLQYSSLENPHRQRGQEGYCPQSHRVGHDWGTKHSTAQHFIVYFLRSSGNLT